jgi:dual specificity protein kinase YAK1
MSEPELAYMTGTADEFDLPRWQTQQHPDTLSSSAQAHGTAQSSYLYSAPPPPPSLTAGPRLPPLQQSPTGSSRQPRISQLLEQDQQLALNSTSYLSSSQNQLSRSASLGGAAGGNSAARGRRHHQPDDLEGAFTTENQSQTNSRQAGPPQHHPANAFYPPSVSGYHPQSLTATAVAGASSPSLDSYQDMYFSGSGGNAPKRSQTTRDSSTSRSGRSPGNTPNSHLDPYSQQAQYSPTTAPYIYTASSDQRNHPSSAYQSHSRSQSQVKSETSTPPISSPYTPHISVPPAYSTYAMDTSSPHPPPPPSQNHLSSHIPARQSSVSTPSTPLSYNHPSSSPSYYHQDQSMLVEVPQQKRRASGLVRIRDARDLRPRINNQPTNRRMDSTGVYLSPLRQLTTNILETYHICNPQFRYESTLNPRRVLTKPSKPAHNDGYDNDDYDYILYVNDWLGSDDGHNRYLILDILGQGTFGQVVKCQNMKTHEIVAVKVVKNKPAYFNQSMMEVTILEMVRSYIFIPTTICYNPLI